MESKTLADHVAANGTERKTTTSKRWIVLRIDNVSADMQRDVLQGQLEDCLKEDGDLRDVGVQVYHIVRVQGSTACATAAFNASIPANKLAEKLSNTWAGGSPSYEFDNDFDGITPLYEAPDADVE